jgi:hypothetical protein
VTHPVNLAPSHTLWYPHLREPQGGHLWVGMKLSNMVTLADRLRDAELQQWLAAVQVEGAKLAEENAALRKS